MVNAEKCEMNVFNTWKKLDEMSLMIKSLWVVIVILMVLNVLMFMGWKSAPSKLRIYIPPNLSQGVLVSPTEVPKNTVYAFAFQIFTAINTWTNNGTKDYQNNIAAYRNYLSPSFYESLENDYQKRMANGALSRTRIMSGVSGQGYQPSDVKPLGNDTWLVNIQLQIKESVGASVVKNVIMDYPLMITRVNESIQDNPWGLSINGFSSEPYRVKTII